MAMFLRLVMFIIIQFTRTSNHQIPYLQYVQFVNYISITLEKQNKKISEVNIRANFPLVFLCSVESSVVWLEAHPRWGGQPT